MSDATDPLSRLREKFAEAIASDDVLSVDDITEGMTVSVPGPLGEPMTLRVDDKHELSPGHVMVTLTEVDGES